jgi:hypothetical protein
MVAISLLLALVATTAFSQPTKTAKRSFGWAAPVEDYYTAIADELSNVKTVPGKILDALDVCDLTKAQMPVGKISSSY